MEDIWWTRQRKKLYDKNYKIKEKAMYFDDIKVGMSVDIAQAMRDSVK